MIASILHSTIKVTTIISEYFLLTRLDTLKMFLYVGISMNPAELSGVGVVIVQTKNCLGIQKVLNGDEDDTNEN